MDYEKKYKEALKVMKSLYVGKFQSSSDASLTLQTIEKAFPELKKSEDERIRKHLISRIRDLGFGDDLFDAINTKGDILSWLEKQGEQKPTDEDDEHILSIEGVVRDNRFIDFDSTGTSFMIPLETSLKNDDKVLVKIIKQESILNINKIEPKFKVGDWIVQENIGVYRVIEICKSWYEVIDFEDNHYSISFDNEYMCHLWTIQDLKDGDVLYYKSPLTDIEYIVMSSGVNEYGNIDSHFRYKSDDWFGVNVNSVFNAHLNNITLANKKQRNILFQKMKEAGYEWNAEKKELKKIEQKPTWNEEECDINGLCAAIDILQKTLGKVEGYQSDDGILEHERAISALKQFAEKNPAWNEKDENIIDVLKNAIKEAEQTNPKIYNKELCNLLFIWLKSLKNRISQPHWKPSEEQMKHLKSISVGWHPSLENCQILSSLYNDLKNL